MTDNTKTLYNALDRIKELEKENKRLTELLNRANVRLAEEYYYQTYPVTLNIGEEARKEKFIDNFLACNMQGISEVEE